MTEKTSITVSFSFPKSFPLDVPNGKYIPEQDRQVDVDVESLAKFEAACVHVFKRGLDHLKDVSGQALEKDYPDITKRTWAGRDLLIDRLDDICAKGIIPTGGGGSPTHPKVAEFRKIIVLDYAKNGVTFPGKATEIKGWSQATAIATTMLKAIAKVQKAKPSQEELDGMVEAQVANWDARIDRILAEKSGADIIVFATPEPEPEAPAESAPENPTT